MRKTSLVAVVALAFLLSSCVPESHSSAPSTSGTASASALPSDTASPSGSPSPARSPSASPSKPVSTKLVVSTAGIGPIRIGAAVPANSGIVTWNPTYCEGAGAWLSTLPKTTNQNDAFYLSTRNQKAGPVLSVLVWSPDIVTPSGLHVGSTEAALVAALPKAVAHTGEAGERWYSVTSGNSRLTFTLTKEGSASSYTVNYILVLPSSSDDVSYYGTDAVGPCES